MMLRAVGYKLVMPPPRHADLRSFRVLVLDHHPLLPTANAVRSALGKVADGLARAGTKIGRTSALLPDLTLVSQLCGQLLMSFTGADLPDDAYQSLQAAAATLSPDDVSQSAMSLRGSVMSHRDWIRTDRIRAGVAHQWRQFFREWDVILCPVMPTPAFPHDHRDMNARRILVDGEEIPYANQSMWSALATLTGLPATAIPISRSDDGLPIGMQIVGPHLEDRTTITFAQLAEREFGGFVAPPGFRN